MRPRSVRSFAAQRAPAPQRCGSLPEHLQRHVEDYDRRAAEEAASRQLLLRILNTRFGGILGVGVAGFVAYVVYCFDDVSSEIHNFTSLVLRSLSPAAARGLLVRIGAWHMLPSDYDKEDPYLVIEPLENFRLTTPFGLAAGFDTEAVAADSFLSLGFGLVEVGPVGGDAASVAARLAALDRTGPLTHLGKVGVAIKGERVELLRAVPHVGPHVDYLAAHLADDVYRRGPDAVQALVANVVDAAALLPGGGPRVFLRVPATLLAKPADVAVVGAAARRGGADGLVLCGEGLNAEGEAYAEALVDALGAVYKATEGELVLISCGGVRCGLDALHCLEAGASAMQIAGPLVEEGPQVIRRIKNELSALLMNEGYVNLADVVGSAHRKRTRGKARRNPWKGGAAAPRAGAA